MPCEYTKCGLCGRCCMTRMMMGRKLCPQCFRAWMIGYTDAKTREWVETQFDKDQAEIVFGRDKAKIVLKESPSADGFWGSQAKIWSHKMKIDDAERKVDRDDPFRWYHRPQALPVLRERDVHSDNRLLSRESPISFDSASR